MADSPNPPPRKLKTREQAIDELAEVLAVGDIACASMTPREQAEAAWTPTSPYSVDELEDRIRLGRGLEPLRQAGEGVVEAKPVDADGS